MAAKAQWIRRGYVADGEAAAALPVLRRFDIVRVPGGVEVRDEDGTVYAGRVTRERGGAQWVLEAGGRNERLGEAIAVTGRFLPGPTAGQEAGAEVEPPGGFLRLPFAGQVRVGADRLFELRARPEE